MPYVSNGTLTTDTREVAISETWDTQTDWEAYQSESSIVITNGILTLEQTDLPVSVNNLYEYEDDSDTSIALDSVGNNDMNVAGATFVNTSAVGNLALSHDGTDDQAISQNTVDLASLGSTNGMAISAFVNWQSLGSLAFNFALWWGSDSDNFISLFDDGSSVGVYGQVSGSSFVQQTPFSPTMGQFYHIYLEWSSGGNVILEVDRTEQINTTTTGDPLTVGQGDLSTGYSPGFGGNYTNVIVDDFAPCIDPLTESEKDTLQNR